MKKLAELFIFGCFISLFFVGNVLASCIEVSSGWCYPTGTSNLGNYLGFSEQNPDFNNWRHLAKDVEASHYDSVFAIGDGYVVYVNPYQSNYGGVNGESGGVVIIRHLTSDDVYLDVLYGHLENILVSTWDPISAGQEIGKINNYQCSSGACPHLHFSVGYSETVNNGETWSLQIQGYSSLTFGINDVVSGIFNPFPYLAENAPWGYPIPEIDLVLQMESVHIGGGGLRMPDPEEDPSPGLPDFVVTDLWLETPGGVEKYSYDKTDEIKMKAQFKNIGDDDVGSDDVIESRFYLSMGYKEDNHSDWIRVGTDETLGSNLDPGETHTETEGLKLWEYSEIEEGKTYNIVACIDRTADQNNGDGAYPEEHKSNNCSTEAVFTVLAYPDLRIQIIQIEDTLGNAVTSAEPGDTIRILALAENIGYAIENASGTEITIPFYISNNDEISFESIGIEYVSVANLTATNSQQYVVVEYTIPNTYLLGVSLAFKTFIDSQDIVVESQDGAGNWSNIARLVVDSGSVPQTVAPPPINPAVLSTIIINVILK